MKVFSGNCQRWFKITPGKRKPACCVFMPAADGQRTLSGPPSPHFFVVTSSGISLLWMPSWHEHSQCTHWNSIHNCQGQTSSPADVKSGTRTRMRRKEPSTSWTRAARPGQCGSGYSVIRLGDSLKKQSPIHMVGEKVSHSAFLTRF